MIMDHNDHENPNGAVVRRWIMTITIIVITMAIMTITTTMTIMTIMIGPVTGIKKCSTKP